MAMNNRLLRPRASGGFSPDQVADLIMWLDAADSTTITLDSSAVSEWRDKANDKVFAQTTANNRPGLSSINGKTAVDFDGTNDTLSCVDAFATYPFSMFIVQLLDAYTFYGMTYTIGSSNNYNVRQYETDGRINIQSPSSGPIASTQTYSLGSADVLALVWKSTAADSQVYLNGQEPLFGGIFSEPTLSGTHYIGTRAGSFPMDGKIGEILVYGRTVSADERQSITSYLGTKWGVTIT